MAVDPLRKLLWLKQESLEGRANRIVVLSPKAVGLRRGDLRFAPSPAHFEAAQARLDSIDRLIRRRLVHLGQIMEPDRRTALDSILIAMAMVEREIDRARRSFGMFFEIFAQRGTAFAPALAAHDAIAADCYRAVRLGLPGLIQGPVLKPITYMEHGYSPATMRRGVSLARLLGEPNPFPLIRIPWDRDRPWQSVFLHEVAHNLMADLRVWHETKDAVIRRLAEIRLPLRAIAIYGRWHKEIFADLAAILLGGPAAAFGMAEFLAHPADRVMTYRPGGAHPVGYLRIFIMAEMLRRLGFVEDADMVSTVWRRLYDPERGHRIPPVLMETQARAIPAVVDEIAFQPRRALAQQALSSVIRFRPEDQAAIRRGAFDLKTGHPPQALPPRHVVSACLYALEAGAEAQRLSLLVIRLLAHRGTGWRGEKLANPAELLPAPIPSRLPAAMTA
ncbi:hypothetical protein [Geminicoccus roseus]|uniref:hypothetical protein n=1 Tax=Geminicoccus roseus TaxID=404900 RepID=UPI000424ACF8|nr:hypothetical protein [Geminicoccus roseus]